LRSARRVGVKAAISVNCQKAGRRSPASEPDSNTEQTMFAVIKTGGKQYRVAADETITIMSLAGEPGESVTFGEVLMLTGDGSTELGAPSVAGASVTGTIVEHKRGPKVIAFKKRRRKNSKRKRGHRQDLTVIKITGIEGGGGKAGAEAKATKGAE
jgi:large subunit ribosomal protein L21